MSILFISASSTLIGFSNFKLIVFDVAKTTSETHLGSSSGSAGALRVWVRYTLIRGSNQHLY